MARVLTAILILAALFGLCLQSRWDADCAQSQPGTHWNADDWNCA